jgi:hypothetical protein
VFINDLILRLVCEIFRIACGNKIVPA